MRKQKELGNKGFSLVELIVVIAIMAILVGVLAPSLIRYVEKTNVSADTQLADAVKTAVLTAMMDPAVISKDTSSLDFTAAHSSTYVSIDASCSGAFATAVVDTLGADTTTGSINDFLVKKLKSAHDSGAEVRVQIVGNNSVQVQITTTDSAGKKDTSSAATPIEVK